jgi:hypothetical protein
MHNANIQFLPIPAPEAIHTKRQPIDVIAQTKLWHVGSLKTCSGGDLVWLKKVRHNQSDKLEEALANR